MPLPYLHSPAPSPHHPYPDSLPSPRVPIAFHAANLGFGAAPSLPPPRHPLPCELQRAVLQPLRVAKTHAESNPCARQEARGFLLLRAAGSGPPAPACGRGQAVPGAPARCRERTALAAPARGRERLFQPLRANPAPRKVAPLGSPFNVNHHGRTEI